MQHRVYPYRDHCLTHSLTASLTHCLTASLLHSLTASFTASLPHTNCPHPSIHLRSTNRTIPLQAVCVDLHPLPLGQVNLEYGSAGRVRVHVHGGVGGRGVCGSGEGEEEEEEV